MVAHKNQHFIPQCYLRGFAEPPRLRRINVFHFQSGRHIHGASVRDQCSKDYYYGRDGLEQALAGLEDRVAPTIQTMSRDGTVPTPDSKEMAEFLVFTMLMKARTPGAIADANRQASQVDSLVMKGHPNPAMRSRKVEFEYENPLAVTFEQTRLAVLAASDLRLKVLRNSTSHEFVASDAPTVLHNQWCRRVRGLGSTGFASRGLQVFLPLGPSVCAIIYDADVYWVGRDNRDVADIESEEEVRAINRLQAVFADRTLFYQGHHMEGAIDQYEVGECRVMREGTHRVSAFKEAKGQRRLINTSHMPAAVDIPRGALRVKDECRRVPVRERARQWRQEALDAVQHLMPPLEQPPGEPGELLFVREDD